MSAQRWKRRPEGSNWGDFGPDDQLGRLNMLTPELRRKAASEVREGIAFCLSLPLDYPGGNVLNPRRHPPKLRPTVRNGRPNFNYPLELEQEGATDVIADDVVVLYNQYSTQWDALSHGGALFDADGDGVPEVVYYNGYRAHEHIVGPEELPKDDEGAEGMTSTARALGIERMATTGVQGRGVLIDLHHHFGRDRHLVSYDDLQTIMATDRVTVESGDMLCLHTGFGEMLLEMEGNPDSTSLETRCSVLDGRDAKLLEWITDSGISVLIADNYAVEQVPAPAPSKSGACAPIHELCLFKIGVHLGELWYLTDLANWLREHGRNRFLLTAPPLRLPGAVGSPVTPVATV